MKRTIDKKRTIRPRPAIRNELDSHKWATKMEIRRFLSGRAELKIKAIPKPTAQCACTR